VLAVDDIESSLRSRSDRVKEKFPGLLYHCAGSQSDLTPLSFITSASRMFSVRHLGTSFEMAETTLVALGFENGQGRQYYSDLSQT
jgi:hypothetical protein